MPIKYVILIVLSILLPVSTAARVSYFNDESLTISTNALVIQKEGIGIHTTPNELYSLDINGQTNIISNPSTELSTLHSVLLLNNERLQATSFTIDWNAGAYQIASIGDDTTISFSDPPGPCNLMLILQRYQTTTQNTVTFPDTILWPNEMPVDLSWSEIEAMNQPLFDIIGFYFDGTSYYGQLSLGFH